MSPPESTHSAAKIQRILLLVWVHGFKGNQATFADFPDDVGKAAQERFSDHDVHSIIYPKYRTVGELDLATHAFVKWLYQYVQNLEQEKVDTTNQGVHTTVILFGHSMGGMLVADAAKEVCDEKKQNPGKNLADVRGVIALDTPFIGIHPALVSYGMEQMNAYIDKTLLDTAAFFENSPKFMKNGLKSIGFTSENLKPSSPARAKSPSGIEKSFTSLLALPGQVSSSDYDWLREAKGEGWKGVRRVISRAPEEEEGTEEKAERREKRELKEKEKREKKRIKDEERKEKDERKAIEKKEKEERKRMEKEQKDKEKEEAERKKKEVKEQKDREKQEMKERKEREKEMKKEKENGEDGDDAEEDKDNGREEQKAGAEAVDKDEGDGGSPKDVSNNSSRAPSQHSVPPTLPPRRDTHRTEKPESVDVDDTSSDSPKVKSTETNSHPSSVNDSTSSPTSASIADSSVPPPRPAIVVSPSPGGTSSVTPNANPSSVSSPATRSAHSDSGSSTPSRTSLSTTGNLTRPSSTHLDFPGLTVQRSTSSTSSLHNDPMVDPDDAAGANGDGETSTAAKKKQQKKNWRWFKAHTEFMSSCWSVSEISERMKGIAGIQKEGIYFVNIYTIVKPSPPAHPKDRTFVSLPTIHHPTKESWKPFVHDSAADQVEAHMALFDKEKHKGYGRLIGVVGDEIEEVLKREKQA